MEHVSSPRRPKPVFAALTRYQLAADIEQWGWRIGPHTYGRPRVLEPEMAPLEIGDFCSIGPDVTIILGNHRMDTATTYPFGVLGSFWGLTGEAPRDHEGRGAVSIGHDVWIGLGATILPGTQIGTGSVIGAQTTARGNIPPYSIVAGNPGRIVRRRFDEQTITRLLALAWWDWPEDKIRAALPLMTGDDLQAFLSAYETPIRSAASPDGQS